MHAVVLLDGRAPERAALDAAWPGWARDVALVVAADGGAAAAGGLGLTIDRWVGDADSIGSDKLADLRSAGVVVDLRPVDKDATDGELAVEAALEAGATRLTLVGALGGSRLDHLLANLGLLRLAVDAGASATVIDPEARVSLVIGPGGIELDGRTGDLVSLLPIGERAAGMQTTGLRYALAGADLLPGRTRGVSNVRTDPRATVSLRSGRLLVVEVPATVPA
jgi:thiamine pyrophosphokinase